MAFFSVSPVPLDSRFPHLTPGYVGQPVVEATLNSRFYFLFWSEQTRNLKAQLFHLPQRVPRAGFFTELSLSDSPAAAEALQEARKMISSAAAGLTAETFSDEPLLFANLAGLAARYGTVRCPDLPAAALILDSDEKFRAALRLCVLQTNAELSQGQPTSLEPIEDLARRALESRRLTEETRAHVLNRLIVSLARYSGGSPSSSFAQAASELDRTLRASRPDGFRQTLSYSVLWRGYAMALTDASERRRTLEKAAELAGAAEASNPVEQLLKQENLVTLYQTLAKSGGGIEDIRRMQELDPKDSTASSELGLIHMKREEWMPAFTAFSAAVALGPPGLAMNLHFKGCAANALGRDDESEQAWKESAELDKTGLSPRLALLERHGRRGTMKERERLRVEILTREELASQLTPEERDELSS